MSISTAIDPGAVARAVGYALGFKDFSTQGENLPQRITIYSVIALSKQAGFTDWNVRHEVSSVQDVFDLFGICPAFYAMRILKPISGGGVGSVPIDIFPILETAGAQATGQVQVIGTADKTVVHTVVFNGRKFIDGQSAQYTVEIGDTNVIIGGKILAAINAFLYSSVDAQAGGSADFVEFETKWQTLTADEVSITIDTGTDDAGLTYAFGSITGSGGAFDLSTALGNMGEIWTTMIINTFDESLFDVFENHNGVPDPDTGGTGRWNSLTVKPYVACLGNLSASKTVLAALAAGREADLTNCLAVAPNSQGLSFEAAANFIGLMAAKMNLKPHSTIQELYFWDMPYTLTNIGDFREYADRNILVKDGVSTVTFDESLGYRVEDFITFRRIVSQSETKKDWRYVRDITGIDFNVIFRYKILEETELTTKTIVKDDEVVDSDISADVIKSKDWKNLLYKFADALVKKAIITDAQFMKDSILADVSGVNPKRFDTRFYYKRTSTVRISATTAFAGFNFGS